MQIPLELAPQAATTGEGPFTGFHPSVVRWFQESFKAPTEVQGRAWAITAQRHDALITAPTGSGKTLAAFLAAINDLVVEGLNGGLSDEVHVLYVSPLKALSNDIQKNLQRPLAGIREQLAALGYPDVPIRDAVRTGDTPQGERERMRRQPPHILVTTPESLFILLTSDAGRRMLARVRSVIVDELHAVAGSKRGAHLMLSLARLDALCGRPPVRIGLSATVKPIEQMAAYLVGRSLEGADRRAAIVDTGHVRERDLALELPRSPLDAVMANEVWAELYDRLAELIRAHRTTLIFVNQRTLAERAARRLAERVGEAHITAHHGSLAKEHRLDAERRLKSGQLKALVATSALELGIDIGEIDLVCQLGSPRSIAALLQRVGRAGHAIGAIPKGRLFPLNLDDLVECSAMLDAASKGELDRVRVPEKPLDVLAQHLTAEVSCTEWSTQGLYERCRSAYPYRELTRAEFDQVVTMVAEGFSTRRGRRSAYLHLDAVNGRLRARRGAKLTAVTNAGVIPDQFDYDVILSPEGHRVGSLNEDFSFESAPGDIFQLGNTSYRILKVEVGKVIVQDARGLPPTMPFWFGEAPARTPELCAAVSRLSERAEQWLAQGEDACREMLAGELALPEVAAAQLAHYLAAGHAALTRLPTLDTVIFERFFDEVGDTHLVIHSPFGSRINRAWGLALRKRFCRQFNFELQASALEDSIVLSLGPTHSFPLEEVRHFLKSATARDVLTQAVLDAPMFGTRWRWNASIALAIRRSMGGTRRPPQFQRSDAEDLLAVIFPDQLACAENLTGEREIPDHPLVAQTLRDCLNETMDVEGFLDVIRRIESGSLHIICRDLSAPSPMSASILNARPYAFLDDGAAEERRTSAVRMPRLGDVQSAADLGQLDPAAIARVRVEAWPEAANADELHDALLVSGFLTDAEAAREPSWPLLLDELIAARRATRLRPPGGEVLWVAAERLHAFSALHPQAVLTPVIQPVGSDTPEADEALRELLRNRLELLGPITAENLAQPLGVSASSVTAALIALETEGAAMRRPFTGVATDAGTEEWCERRMLARIHRYTLERRRAEHQPVPATALMQFLLAWQGIDGEGREGEAGLLAVLQQLEGAAAPAGAWEADILPARVQRYLPLLLDRLCSAGRIQWWRPPAKPSEEQGVKSGPVRGTPIVLCEREHAGYWQMLSETSIGQAAVERPAPTLSGRAQRVLDSLRTHGASFHAELMQDCGLLRSEAEQALAELVSHGLVTADSFSGLRALITPAEKRRRSERYSRQGLSTIEEAGRWSLRRNPKTAPRNGGLADPAVEHAARVLLRRYGVVFRKLIERETLAPPWRELFYVYRRMEARDEIRGGRFVQGYSGEQFALPDAAVALRRAAKEPSDRLVSISAADPLNLQGWLLPGERVPALSGNRLLLRGGKVIAVQIAGEVRYLEPVSETQEWDLRNLLVRQAKHAGYIEQPDQAH